jgi:hypothetical protein
MEKIWIAISAFVAIMGVAGPAAAEHWSFCEVYTDDRKYYTTEVYEGDDFRSLTAAAFDAVSVGGLRHSSSPNCFGKTTRGEAEADRQAHSARARGLGYMPVAWDVRSVLKHRISYYFCVAPASGRILISDLLFNPGWIEPTQDHRPFANVVEAAGGRPGEARCRRVTPIDYIKALNEAYPGMRLVRTSYNSEGKPFGPNLVDDLAAREKYAKLWADPKNLPVPGAGPSKPAQTAGPKPAPIGAALTIKAGPGPQSTSRAWDAQVASEMRKEAQRQAELASKAAQNDARLKAQIERARQERVKRGRAQ